MYWVVSQLWKKIAWAVSPTLSPFASFIPPSAIFLMLYSLGKDTDFAQSFTLWTNEYSLGSISDTLWALVLSPELGPESFYFC